MSSTPSSPRLVTARRIMLALLLASLGAGLLVPVYTDEVAWRFQLSRFVQNGGVDRGIGESCGANTIAVPPFFMWPVRVFSSGVTAIVDDPLGVRIAGVGFAMVAVLLLRAVIRRVGVAGRERDRTELFSYAALGLGVLPFLLVWSRPEQPLLLALLVALLAMLGPADPGRPARLGPRLGLIVATGLVALAYHPKGVFYVVAFVGLALAAAPLRRPWTPRLVAGGVLLAAAAIGYRYWAHRLGCSGDPALAARLNQENAAMLLLHGGWGAVLRASPRIALAALPVGYVGPILPIAPFMSNWLPNVSLPLPLVVGWSGLTIAGWLAVVVAGVVALARAVRADARSPRLLAAALALLAPACAFAAFQLIKNVYESALYLPVLLVVIVLARAAAPPATGRWRERGALALAGASLVSQLLLLGTFVPALARGVRSGGYVAGQATSVSPFAYPRAVVAAAGAACGLAPRPGLSRMVVDDLTYFAYAHTAQPLHYMGVVGMWRGSIPDPLRWMRTHDVAGAVLACTELPPDMQARAVRHGALCCLRTR